MSGKLSSSKRYSLTDSPHPAQENVTDSVYGIFGFEQLAMICFNMPALLKECTITYPVSDSVQLQAMKAVHKGIPPDRVWYSIL